MERYVDNCNCYCYCYFCCGRVVHTISNCIIVFSLQDPYERTGDADPVLLAVVTSSNLKKMSEQQKWYCRKGHENEAKFCKQFHALIDLKCSNNV